jgi:hypothetical protein
MNKFIDKFLKWLLIRCPDRCGGMLHTEFYDMKFDKLVWKCSKCKKEFI